MQEDEITKSWCKAIVEVLLQAGVQNFFVAPGSRSTPLLRAMLNNSQAKIHSGIDERSLVFAALGFAKVNQFPAVLLVTSGTALANLAPAVCEAKSSEVPLLIISADRPFELHDCGANQTMKQDNFFISQVNKSLNIPSPCVDVPLHKVKAQIFEAFRYTLRPIKGPVHINIQLRELQHSQDGLKLDNNLGYFFLKSEQEIAVKLAHDLSGQSGLLVVGELMPTGLQQKILDLAELLNWPVYADISSNLRLKNHKNILNYFEISMLNSEFKRLLNFDIILKLGGRLVSKRFWAMLENRPAKKLLSLSESSKNLDQSGLFENIVIKDLLTFLDVIISSKSIKPAKSGFTKLESFNQNVKSCLEQNFDIKKFNEAYLARRLIAQISKPAQLFVSSSMPIRDLDLFAGPSQVAIDIFANRGLSGIDGVISSAVGMAMASSKPSILLIGDVAFLHDTNGLMLLSQSTKSLLIIVINNGGGGIFHFLPVAKEPRILTPFTDTPHKVNLAYLCKAHEITHTHISDFGHFDEVINNFLDNPCSQVLEITIDKEQNVAVHHEIFNKIRDIKDERFCMDKRKFL